MTSKCLLIFAVCLIAAFLFTDVRAKPIDDNNVRANDDGKQQRVDEGLLGVNTLLQFPGRFFNDFVKNVNNGLGRIRGFMNQEDRSKRSIAVEELARIIDRGRDEIQSIASQFENPVDGIENNVQDVGEFFRSLLV